MIDARDWSLLGLLSILWGGSFFFNGVVLRELPPLTFVLLRVAIASLMLLPLLGLPDRLGLFGLEAILRDRALQQRAAVLADRGGADLCFQRTCLDPQRHHPTVHDRGDGGRRRGKLSARRISGLVAGSPAWSFSMAVARGVRGGSIGILLCLAAAFSYGLAALLARRLLSNSPPLGTATFQLLASAVMMMIVAGLIDRPWQLPVPRRRPVAR